MRAKALIIAGREFATGLRNFWVAGAVVSMLVFSMSLALLGSAPAGEVGADPLSVLVISLASLSVFLLPLIALLLAHDAIAGEIERGTFALTLSYPISRMDILAGKFIGHLTIIALAAILGFGAAALTALSQSGWADFSGLPAFFKLLASAIATGAIFLSLGYVASSLVKERATAIGLCIGLWLLFVIIWDLAFLGLLVSVGESLPSWLVSTVILLNPADVFRLFNLTSTEAVQIASGLSSLDAGKGVHPMALIGAMACWLVITFGINWILLRHKEV